MKNLSPEQIVIRMEKLGFTNLGRPKTLSENFRLFNMKEILQKDTIISFNKNNRLYS